MPSKTNTEKTDSASASSRAQYSEPRKAVVRAKYNLCRTPEDRDQLAEMADIESRQKLYNLSSRLGATRPHAGSSDDWSEAEAEGYDAARDYARLYMRENPAEVAWSPRHDQYLREHFGQTFIESIAFFLDRSETSVSYRARELNLRNVPKYWDIRKVAPWLGLKMTELFELRRVGLELFPCTDKHGETKIILASTTSLARVLLKNRLWKRLVDPERYEADEFFIKDIIESVVALQKGDAVWEPNSWVSHGHTCLNPFADLSFGLFYNGHDKKMDRLEELDPRDLSPKAKVRSDDWRRGVNGQDDSDEQLEKLRPVVKEHSWDDQPAAKKSRGSAKKKKELAPVA